MLVLSEWFGVTSCTFDVATKLSSSGLDAYVVNSYRDHQVPVDNDANIAFATVDGVSGVNTDSAHKMSHLQWDALAADVVHIAEQLSQDNKGPVVLFGMSEGGALAMLASQRAKKHINATAVFYGSPGNYCGHTATQSCARMISVRCCQSGRIASDSNRI